MCSLWKSGSQLLLETPSFIHGLEPSATEVVRVPRAETASVFTVFLGSMHIVQLFLFKLLQCVTIAEAHAVSADVRQCGVLDFPSRRILWTPERFMASSTN